MNVDPKGGSKREESVRPKGGLISLEGDWAFFLKKQREVSFLIFLVFGIAVILTCFGGQSAIGSLILPNQTPRMRVTAGFSFRYESKLLTQRKQQEQLRRVPPAYKLDLSSLIQFEKAARGLLLTMIELEKQTDPLAQQEFLEKALSNGEGRMPFSVEDVLALASSTTALERAHFFEEALFIIKELFKQGILDVRSRELFQSGQDLSLLNIHRDSGQVGRIRVQTMEEALRFLRINLWSMDISQDLAMLLFRIFKVAIIPNLTYDPERTHQLQEQAVESVSPQIVTVLEGDTIVEPGEPVSQQSYEQLVAYRKQLKNRKNSTGFLQIKQLLAGLVLWLSSFFIVRLLAGSLLENNRRLAMAAFLVFINVAIMRVLLHLGELNLESTRWIALLPFLLPFALAPLMLTLMVGPVVGVCGAVLVSGFGGLMQTYSFEFFQTAFLASLVGVFFAQQARLRRRIVRAGVMTGLTAALLVFAAGVMDEVSIDLLAEQSSIALALGVVTGGLVLLLLPALEVGFNHTSDVTLLELTDHNHPLLRKMQMKSPGTYHHSLMVASLAENAAGALGANALLCRTASLFHDIGKLVKPEYFIENQTEGNNPHIERNPSMSALIIKAHVKEGAEIAKKYKLPPVLLDVIRQHHGTSLIYYFYVKARQQSSPSTPRLSEVEESTYRYDGPKPNFSESAIISLADAIEAASRSLPKISPQAIDELVANVINERLQDGQLSDCTLTFADLSILQKSFAFTLINMLHNRPDTR